MQSIRSRAALVRKGLILAFFALSVLALPAMASAVPGTLLLEGVLHGSGGGPAADGDYTVTFTVYDKQSGGAVLHQDKDVKVTVTGGRFTATIGAAKPVDGKVLNGKASAWLGIKIGADPELPVTALHSVPFALQAGTARALDCVGCIDGKKVAGGSLGPAQVNFAYAAAADGIKGGDAKSAKALKCTGCVGVDHLLFDKDVNLKDKTLTAAKVTSGSDVVAKGTVAAKEFIGDGSKLTGIKTPAGECKTAGEVVKGINPDGSLKCVKAMDPSALPKDGLKNSSNGLLSTQFNDPIQGATNQKIKDNNPDGILTAINFPDIGIAQQIEVNVDIFNSDTADLAVFLFPPNAPVLPAKRSSIINNYPTAPSIDGSKYPHYVLHMKKRFDPGNKTTIKTTFPTKTKPISGDIHKDWLNKNIKGSWRLLIIDTAFLNNGDDGELKSWNITIQTLSNKQVEVNGTAFVKETLWGPYQGSGKPGGTLKVGGDLEVGGNLKVNGNTPYSHVFTYLGKKTCPAGAKLLYDGAMFSGHYGHTGGNSGLCVRRGDPGPSYGYEGDLLYPMHTSGSMPPGIPSSKSIYCAVCEWEHGHCFEMWGTDKCPTNWKKVYGGLSIGSHYTHHAPAGGHYCIDPNGFDTSKGSSGNGHLYGTRVQSGHYGSEFPSGRALKCGLCCRG